MYGLILEKAVDTAKELPNLQVVLIGIGTVFAGLVCIVLLCKIIGWIFGKKVEKSENAVVTTPATQAQAQATAVPIENRQQIIAAVSAAIAEELGTEVSAIRILSFKKI